MLHFEHLDLHMGGHPLLEDVSLHLHSRDRVGLVGRNGSGKTSLLRCLVGEELPTSGQVQIGAHVQIGYLPQNAVSGSKKSVWEEVKSAMGRLNALEQEINRLQQKSNPPEYLFQLIERFE